MASFVGTPALSQAQEGQYMANHPMVPTRAFFTKGVGVHKNKLQSFELALR